MEMRSPKESHSTRNANQLSNILDNSGAFKESALIFNSLETSASDLWVSVVPFANARESRDRDKGEQMTKRDEAARRQRRNFLKTAGSAAMALVATKDAFGQNDHTKPATQLSRRREEPNDRGLWGTWDDLPNHGREA